MADHGITDHSTQQVLLQVDGFWHGVLVMLWNSVLQWCDGVGSCSRLLYVYVWMYRLLYVQVREKYSFFGKIQM